MAVSMSLFAFTTLIGNYSYCEGCLRYILKRKPSKTVCIVMRLAASVVVFLGAIVSMGLVWDTADLCQAIMVVINVPVIIIIAKPALLALKDYVEQKKAGKDPHFIAKNCGIAEETDYWK
ncbi:MAG: alanine:cation symporter family protein [Treponema sp.]|nr:alanine:cation symporter family protein [Treponema sp.]